MNSLKYIAFLILHFGCLALTAQDLSEYTWQTIETNGTPTARHESSMVTLNGKIYLIGGRGVKPVEVYDPETNTWTAKQETPFEIHHFQAVPYQDKIYFLGAMTGKYPKETPLENIWIYYPEKDQWEKGPEIPENRRRGGAGAVLFDDKIYWVCGIDFGHTSGTNNNFDSYDLKTGEWKVLTRAPHIRDHFSAIVVDQKLYVLGGRNTSYHLPNRFGAFFGKVNPHIDVYDFETKKWLTLESILPVPSAAGGLVQLGDHILYFGGESDQKLAHNDCYAMDTPTGGWVKLAPLNTGRHGGGAVVIGDKVYTAAGSPKRGGGNLDSMEVFTLK